MSSVDSFLGTLERVRRTRSGWTARCPAHEDRTASLSVSVSDADRVLLHCHAGCAPNDVLAAVGFTFRDLFSSRAGERDFGPPRASTVQHRGLTLEEYADAKRLPADFLRSLDVADAKYLGLAAIRIPYIDASGNTTAVRYRIAMSGDKFRWQRGAKPCLYGINRLAHARDLGYLVLAEGESDTQTLWHLGFPALGLPGANGWREERDATHFDGLETVYVVIEPDRGGETVLRWLSTSEIRHRVCLVELDAKDVSGSYLGAGTAFAEKLEETLRRATLWREHERTRSALQAGEAWDRCADLAKEPRILDRLSADLQRAGLVGERQVGMILYLALTSRLLDQPVSVAVKGPSSAGKSFVVERVVSFFPPSAYHALTAMSDRALAYGDEPLDHRFLILYEADGMEGDLGAYLVRSLLSEGRIRYETVEKTPHGLQPRLIEREGPTGLMVTTTQVALHPENETRLLSVTVTDTPEQTKMVLLALAEDRPRIDLAEWRALQEWLHQGEHRVVIPYGRALADLVPPIAVRLRRDFQALLNLIRAHALLHQASRDRDEQGRIAASLEDYATIRDLVHQQVSEGVEATVPATVRETVDAVARTLTEDGVSITALARMLEIDKSAASRRWQAARARGYLRNLENGRGKPARLVLADPLPDDVDVLPSTELVAAALDRCTVAAPAAQR